MGKRTMQSVETLKVFDDGFRLLAMTEGGRLCILDLNHPVPEGYRIGMVQIPDDLSSIFDAAPGNTVEVPVIPVRLSAHDQSGFHSCPMAFSQ